MDIIYRELTDDMFPQAKAEQKVYGSKEGRKSKYVNKDKNTAFRGSFGHQIADLYFQEKMDFIGGKFLMPNCYSQDLHLYLQEPHNGYSTRQVRYVKGDPFDIKYEEDTIDVCNSNSKAWIDEKWLPHNDLTVYDHKKSEGISHYLFTRTCIEERQGYIIGVVRAGDFDEYSEEKMVGELKAHFIKPRWKGSDGKNLVIPMSNYIFRKNVS